MVAYIGLGSNLQPEIRLVAVLQALTEVGQVLMVSPYYRSEPLGDTGQPWYINCVVALVTQLPPVSLLKQLKHIERRLGRKQRVRWAAREIDLDILLYDSQTIDTVSLHIPHLELPKRRFALQPLCDIAPTVIDPRSGKTIQQLLQECADTLQVEQLNT
jgi:2-amino-4-hydroxy-6-hydroxymethyldihydropteridine diphosphokinase